MNKLTHSKIISTFLITLVVLSTSVMMSAGASPAEPAPQAPQAIGPGAPVVLRLDPTPSNHRVPPPRVFSPLRAQSATITVNYLAGGTTDVFGTACYNWPQGAKDAFNYAASIWESLINSSVPIAVDACWAELPEGILGYGGAGGAYRDFAGAPQAGTFYPVALANTLSGTDLNGASAEMHVAYSRIYGWYYGTDGNTPTDKLDFASVVLHEICHGLGFSGSMTVDDGDPSNGVECTGVAGVGCWGSSGYPYSYDRFAENGSGQSLINTSLFPNPSAALATQLTSDDVYFDGTNANAANGGTPPKLYAPSTWIQGSSYSHLDEIYNGTQNALMTYALANGESNHSPGPVAMGILQDISWGASGAAPTVTSITPNSGVNTGTVSITNLAGTNFQSGATVKLARAGQSDINASNVNVVSATKVTCDFNLAGAAPGQWDVVVTNPDAQSGTLPNGFAVSAALAPDVSIQSQVVGQGHQPGDPITFTLTIANNGSKVASHVVVTDRVPSEVLAPTYDSTLVVTPTGVISYVWDVQPLGIGQSGKINIYGQLDPSLGTNFAIVNTATIWDPEDNTPDNNTSSTTVGQTKIYLPLVVKGWPPVPATPVLNAINNADGDGNYTVSWSSVSGATGYELQEATNSSFSGATTAYSGASTSTSITGRQANTYYYRVRAKNSYGNSEWSNVQSVTVEPPGPKPGYWQDTSTNAVAFYVTADRAYVRYFAIVVSVQGCGNIVVIRTQDVPISNDQFSFSGSYYASGTFHSETTASGTTGLDNYYSLTCGRYISGGPWSWSATWQNSSQPMLMPVGILESETVEFVTDTGDFYTATLIE